MRTLRCTNPRCRKLVGVDHWHVVCRDCGDGWFVSWDWKGGA